ncbi:MAG: hypothetical protein ACLR0N_13865 [Bilophila wadsworthia]
MDDLASDKPLGTADIALYAHIHYGQASPSIAAEGVDRTSALEKLRTEFRSLPPVALTPLRVMSWSAANRTTDFGEGWACPPGYSARRMASSQLRGFRGLRKAVEPFFHGLRGLFR